VFAEQSDRLLARDLMYPIYEPNLLSWHLDHWLCVCCGERQALRSPNGAYFSASLCTECARAGAAAPDSGSRGRIPLARRSNSGAETHDVRPYARHTSKSPNDSESPVLLAPSNRSGGPAAWKLRTSISWLSSVVRQGLATVGEAQFLSSSDSKGRGTRGR
jgi:hypothetical protein